MADDGTKSDTRSLQTHLRDAETAIAELNRQILEWERFFIPTIGLEKELVEMVGARETLLMRLSQTEEAPVADDRAGGY